MSHKGKIKPFDLQIHKGEVVGLTGLLGSGRSELARVIYGADKNQTGKLFVNGKELANAYSELTDAAAQRARFEQCARERAARGAEVYPLDEDFLAALDSGLPPCAGIALGVDRLAMILAGADTLDPVLAFREG